VKPPNNPIRGLREAHGFTLSEASVAWGVSRSSLSSLEDGGRESLSGDVLEALSPLSPTIAEDYQAWRGAYRTALTGGDRP